MYFKLSPNMEDYFLVKVDLKESQRTIEEIEETWQEMFAGNPLNYYFLDEFFNQQYQSDQKMGRVLSVFSILAIIIALAGLVGLAVFNIISRQKEIGIRKVLGASIPNILTLLSREFMWLILIAGVIATPLAYYWLNNWLQDYPINTGIGWWIFFAPILLVMIIASITISYQTIKAAVANPIESLRYE